MSITEGQKIDRFAKGRAFAFNMTAEKLQLDPAKLTDGIFGMVMDVDFGEAMATVVAFVTGDASVYVQDGPVVVGGFAVPGVPERARAWAEAAARVLPHFSICEQPALPPRESHVFYVLTTGGLYASPAVSSEAVMFTAFRELFREGHELMRLMTLAADQKRASAPSASASVSAP